MPLLDSWWAAIPRMRLVEVFLACPHHAWISCWHIYGFQLGGSKSSLATVGIWARSIPGTLLSHFDSQVLYQLISPVPGKSSGLETDKKLILLDWQKTCHNHFVFYVHRWYVFQWPQKLQKFALYYRIIIDKDLAALCLGWQILFLVFLSFVFPMQMNGSSSLVSALGEKPSSSSWNSAYRLHSSIWSLVFSIVGMWQNPSGFGGQGDAWS